MSQIELSPHVKWEEGKDSPGIAATTEPSSGPIRNKAAAGGTATASVAGASAGAGAGGRAASATESDDASDTPHHSGANAEGGPSRAPVQAPPVKSACTFCRSRKSRCNGKQPCAACISRGQTDDCIYTVSRRGGKPKPKGDRLEPLEAHLEKLLGLSELPHLVRIPNAVSQLDSFQDDSSSQNYNAFQGIDPSQMMNMGISGQSYLPPSTVENGQEHHGANGSPSNFFTSQSERARSRSAQSFAPPPSVHTLFSEYYRLLYRFVAVLPHPCYLDTIAQNISPTSPLVLALQCILPVIRNRASHAHQSHQHQGVSKAEADRKAAIRSESLYFARQAYDAIDEVLERIETQQDSDDTSILEVIQAHCILVIYEYGSGRALKSRLKVDAALTLAMSKGLHRLSNAKRAPSATDSDKGQHYLSLIPDDELFETKKRLWWALWTLAMWTAYNTGRIPTVRADDPRVTSELPAGGDSHIWARVVSSLQGLLLVQDRVLALAHIEQGRAPPEELSAGESVSRLPGNLPTFGGPASSRPSLSDTPMSELPASFSGQPTLSSRDEILRSMAELDNALQEQMHVLDQTTQGIVMPNAHGDAKRTISLDDDVDRFLQFVWATQVYTTSLTLHIGQAFQGATLFERKLCFLSTISEANDAAACQVPMPNAFDGQGGVGGAPGSNVPVAMTPEQDLYARGPFAPRESLKRCVDASDKLLLISRNLRQLEMSMASPNPFNACSFVLISFVCLMQALAISSNTPDEIGANPSEPAISSSDWPATPPSSVNNSASDAFVQSNGMANNATPSLLRSAQGAAALTPSLLTAGGVESSSGGGGGGDFMDSSPYGTQPAFAGNKSGAAEDAGSAAGSTRASRQEQLQQIWGRVKEAKDALQDLSQYWDMAVPMSEEVSGCLEASQFLLSQQNPTADFPV